MAEDKFVITAAQLSDLKSFARDLVTGELDEDEQISMGHGIESIIATCQGTPSAEEDEDEEMDQEDDEDAE